MLTEQVPGARTLGIDLASQPAETAVCVIDWSTGRGEVIDLESRKLTDEVLVEMIRDPAVSKVGIDAPFGWPLAFIDAIASFRDHGVWIDLEANEIRFRATDTAVLRETAQTPLSVAMSDLAWPAMRCARLLSELSVAGEPLDRTGAGRVAEIYPMAALRRWGVIAAGTPASDWLYKGRGPGRQERRLQYLSALRGLLGDSVSLSDDFAARCVDDDDELDAFISALLARATELRLCDPIPRGMRWLASREGWIQLPTPESVQQLAA